MKRASVFLVPVVAALLLAGCVSQPMRAPQGPIDEAHAQAQDQARVNMRDWSLSGRIAVANGKQGGSGRIDWQQSGDRFTVSLSAPVTRQSWRLSGDDRGARLEGIEGGPRESDDVEAMLAQATGWNIPVRALADWVRGVAADEGRYGPARIVYGDGNRPVRVAQAGWTIDYAEWGAEPTELATAPVLPTRLTATRGGAKVRLIVDAWSPGEVQ